MWEGAIESGEEGGGVFARELSVDKCTYDLRVRQRDNRVLFSSFNQFNR